MPGAFLLMRHRLGNTLELADEDRLALALPRGLSVRADAQALADSVLGVRALQAFDLSAAAFPIYRELRFAVRRSLEEVFDDLASHSGARAHRLSAGSLVLQGEGFVASALARRKSDYTSGSLSIWASSLARALEVSAKFSQITGEQRIEEAMFTIDWHFHSSHMGLSNVSFEEVADPAPLDAAYPMLADGVTAYIERFLGAPETILILQGPPGTGKTRLVRAILAALTRRKGENAKVLYTSDKKALESDELYVEFLTGDHDAFVVEDADHLLGSRANGNVDLHRFLTVADGVVRAMGRKIIFTTNLHNIGDIDEALIRPGRCFAVVRTRALVREEASRLLQAMQTLSPEHTDAVLGAAFPSSASSATVAALYRAVDATLRHTPAS
jgi:hypothetical protein